MDLIIAVVLGAILLFVAAFVVGVMIAKFYRKVEQGKALIVNKTSAEPEVTFTGATVLPIIHKAEVMDISVKTIEIDRRGKEGLICRDNIRAKLSEGLKTVGKQLDFVDLYTKRHEFRDAIINLIGRDLNGYILEDAAIDYLEQTPILHLDPMNILDAQ